MDDLVWRDALWCKKFTDVPFTGEVSGKDNGKIKNGNLQDLWIFYYNSGQLYLKTNYKDGNRQGLMEYYSSENGSLLKNHI